MSGDYETVRLSAFESELFRVCSNVHRQIELIPLVTGPLYTLTPLRFCAAKCSLGGPMLVAELETWWRVSPCGIKWTPEHKGNLLSYHRPAVGIYR